MKSENNKTKPQINEELIENIEQRKEEVERKGKALN